MVAWDILRIMLFLLNEVFARLTDPGCLCFSKIAKGIESLTAKAPRYAKL